MIILQFYQIIILFIFVVVLIGTSFILGVSVNNNNEQVFVQETLESIDNKEEKELLFQEALLNDQGTMLHGEADEAKKDSIEQSNDNQTTIDLNKE